MTQLLVIGFSKAIRGESLSKNNKDVSLVRAKEGEPSVPFPWSLAAHHQSLASTLRKTKRLRRF